MNSTTKNSAGDNCKHIKGINCSVKNCIYNVDQNYCTANQIAIASSTASTSKETACATFKPCEGCE